MLSALLSLCSPNRCMSVLAFSGLAVFWAFSALLSCRSLGSSTNGAQVLERGAHTRAGTTDGQAAGSFVWAGRSVPRTDEMLFATHTWSRDLQTIKVLPSLVSLLEL